MRIPLLLGAAALLPACRPGVELPPADGPGMVAVSWVGQDTGRFVAAGRAGWCAADSLLQITAVRGDTGIGLALLVEDTLRAVQHPVLSPEVPVTWRPLGYGALRWFRMRSGDDGLSGLSSDVKGWEATGGVVSVTATDPGPTGAVDLRLRSLGGFDTLRLTGTFTALPLEAAPGGCGRQAALRAGG
jgi:hypothetical protein